MRLTKLRGSVIAVIAMLTGCGVSGIQNRLNQEHAYSSLLRIKDAQIVFKSNSRDGVYGTLEELSAAKLIDSSLAAGRYKGYLFKVRVMNKSFEAVAVPESYGHSGYWSFYINDLGVVHGALKNGQEATADDPPIKIG